MPVYVDDMEAPFGRYIMCHMYADTHTELVDMARRIGVDLRWIQYAGNPAKVHFDIAKSKRAKAVKAGAFQTTWRDFGIHAMYQRQEHKSVHRHEWGQVPRVWVSGNKRTCLKCGTTFPALIASSTFDEPCPGTR
jgi:hypothetical protein